VSNMRQAMPPGEDTPKWRDLEVANPIQSRSLGLTRKLEILMALEEAERRPRVVGCPSKRTRELLNLLAQEQFE
jgi:hypothetical protein